MPRLHHAAAIALTAALTACATPAPAGPGAPAAPTLRLDALATAETLARPRVYDWSSHLVTGAKLERLRRQALAERPLPAQRRVLALTAGLDLPGAGFAGSAATGRISAPAYDAARDRIYWLAENGWLLRRDRATGTDAALPISATDGATPTDTFPETQITLSKDGKRVYVCSAAGRFFALDADTGHNLMNSPWEMGEVAPDMGYTPAPCVDAVASRADGQVETVYAVTTRGTLYRFVVDGSGESLPPYMQKAETYAMAGYGPRNAGDVGPVDRFRVSPVAIGGMVFMQVTRPEEGSFYGRPFRAGRHLIVDTLATAPVLAPTVGQVLIALGGATHVVGAQPSLIQVDDQMRPFILFSPDLSRPRLHFVNRDFLAAHILMSSFGVSLKVVGNASPADGRLPYRQSPDVRGVTTPFISAMATDPLGDRVFTLANNTLYQLSYARDPIYDPDTGLIDDNFAARDATFGANYADLPARHWYAKTTLGRSDGVFSSPGTFVENPVPPYFDGTHVWAVDNFPRGDGTVKMTLNKFLPVDGGPPSLVDAVDLGALAPGATMLDGRMTSVPGGPLLLTTAGASPRLFGF